MAITEPLDLWDILAVKFAGLDPVVAGSVPLTIFFFISMIVIAFLSAKFRLPVIAIVLMLGMFAFLVYASGEGVGSFVIFIVIFVIMISFLLVPVLKRIFD
jgi:hypothetical protein